jgi:hypothetical protein
MGSQQHIGSGLDQPRKPGMGERVMDKVLQMADPEPQAAKDEDARARRIEQERNAFDLDHKPTDRDAQIDGSGARFEVDA